MHYLQNKSLKEGANMKRFYPMATALFLLAALSWDGSQTVLYGQEKAAEKSLGPFSGTVVDAAGKPVAGATVWLLSDDFLDAKAFEETRSDQEGRFQFAEKKWDLTGRRGGPEITARDMQGRIGGQVRERVASPTEAPANPYQNIKVKLQEVKECQGRLVDESNHPIAKAKIRPTMWSWERREENFMQDLIFLPANLTNEMAVETDADGRFTLAGIPTVGRIVTSIDSEEFGEPRVGWKTDKTLTFKLKRAGTLQGKLICAQDAKAAAGIKIEVREKMERGDMMEADSWISYFNEFTTDTDGGFRLDKVPQGSYTLMAQLPEDFPYYLDQANSFEVKAGSTAMVSLKLQPAFKVQGKIVDGETGTGIAGARVYLDFLEERSRGSTVNPATTDAEGSFSLFAHPGKARINVFQLPDQYLSPSNSPRQQPMTIDIKEHMTLDPMRIDRAQFLEGIVVDKAGNPVADAEIRATDTDYGVSLHDIIRSDAVGKFTVKKISPKKTLIVRVRTKTAMAEPMNVVPADLKEPLRVVVDEKGAFTLRATVVDEAGKPIPQADVGLTSHWSWGGGGLSFQSHTCKTDEAGKFEFGGLWPGDGYTIRVSLKGYEKVGTPQVNAKPGEVHDFGRLVLFAASGAVAGVVLDSSSQPVANVRVFNSGDGPEPIETTTDGSGKFRLEGFRRGRVFLFADKDGYRFTALRTTTDSSDAVMKLLRSAEPVPPLSISPQASISDAEKQCARALLEKLHETADDRLKSWAEKKIDQMDREKSAKTENAAPTPSKENPLYKIAAEDVDEALSQIPKADYPAYTALKDLAKHFAVSDPDKSQRFVAEAVVHVRNFDQPQRTMELARMGALASRLGNKEGGKKIALEAADMADKWGVTDRNRYDLSRAARWIAVCDPSRALAIVKKFPENEQGRYTAEMAGTLDDVAQAEAILKSCDQGINSWYSNRARVQLACRIALKQPEEAVRIVDNLASTGRDDEEKAKAYGWLALLIAPKNQKMANDLIDRAFKIYLTPSSEYSMGNEGGRPAQAAVLAVTAQQIGYPDLESAINRALATRPTTGGKGNRFDGPGRVLESSTMLAMFLALIDRDSAKQVLQSIEPQSDSIGSGFSGVGREEWFKAWALVDPQHARELVEKELAADKDANASQRLESDISSIIELWLTAPGNRLKNISQRYRQLFRPDESEDL